MDYAAEIDRRLSAIKNEGLYRECRVEEGISFSHNDYLGLSAHERIQEATSQAARLLSTGSRGSRLLGGELPIFSELEGEIARFFGAPAALFFSTGYLANLAAAQVASSLVDHVLSDSLNHASLIDGLRLSATPKSVVPHGSWSQVDRFSTEKRLVVSETLFSMDGDFVDPAALALAADPNVFFLLDEAHAAGIFREDGRGVLTDDFRSALWSRGLVTLTFGKAFGVAGAAILCSRSLRELLVNQARSFIYTTAPSPVVAAAVLESLKVVADEPWRRRELWDRAEWARRFFSEGLNLKETLLPGTPWSSYSPIIPLPLAGSDRALRFSETMRKSGIDLRAIRFPTVPRGHERIRLTVNLGMSRENLENAAVEMVRVWTEFS